MRKMLLAAAALAVALAASAQEPKFDFRRDSTRTSGFTLPDSLVLYFFPLLFGISLEC